MAPGGADAASVWEEEEEEEKKKKKKEEEEEQETAGGVAGVKNDSGRSDAFF